jgi:photosystem II stability/assembly factor-like uncharacterized protein
LDSEKGVKSMPKTLLRFWTLAAIIFYALCLSPGCSKSEKKMEMPDIKIITRENVHGVIAPDDNNIWITGNYGTIYHSSDGGGNWAKQDSGVDLSILCDGSFINSKTGWIVGLSGTIIHTTDKGATWTKQETGTERHLFSVFFKDENHGWAVGEWNTIIHTSDGGKTWESQAEEQDKIFANVFFVDNENGWAVGERGIIMHTTDAGVTWNTQMPKTFERESFEDELINPRPALYCVIFTDPDTGWISGIDGTILHTTDAGKTWDVLPTNAKNAVYSIFIKDGKGWAVGEKGTYLMSPDGGKTWKVNEDAIESKFWFRDVRFTNSKNGWVVGQGGTVIHTTDGGNTWEFYSGLSFSMKFFQMPKALEFDGGNE